VFPNTSQVLLVTDPTSGVGVILENTRIRGILKGRAYGQLQVADVSPDSRIKPGEPIVTSGGDQIFPRGLPVGTVEQVIPDPERDPDVDVLVHPAAGLSQLEEVLVITNMTDSISPQESKDLAESEAEGEAAMKRASDVLSEKLPSRIDPNAPADTNPEDLVDAAGNAARKTPPPKPEHPDGFSPNSEPAAAEMIPGQRSVPVRDGTEELPPGIRPHPVANAPAPSSGTAAANSVTPMTPAATGATTQPIAATGVTPKPVIAPPAKPATSDNTTPPTQPKEQPAKKQPGAPVQPQTLTKPQPVGTESVGANGIGNLPPTQVIDDGPIVRSTRKPSTGPEPVLNTESQPLPDIPGANPPAPAAPQWRFL
jgi:rod shape-determining protein MreC